MDPDPDVLVLTNQLDVSADWVVRELRARHVPFLRINSESLALCVVDVDPLTGRWLYEQPGRGAADLSRVKSVWYRRPEPPTRGSLGDLAPAEHAMLINQWQALVDALCIDLTGGLRVMNDPQANRRAEAKILQLSCAKHVGFDIPSTLVTNNFATAHDFAAAHGGSCVLKGLDAPFIDGPEPRFVFASRVAADTLAGLPLRQTAPVIIQEEVKDKVDVRVTVVGSEVFAAQTVAPEGQLDWRERDPPAQFTKHVLDDEVSGLCVALTKELGLLFGAIDLAVVPDGSYMFFEINPNGEWGWLQRTLRAPIAQMIVDVLTG